jgi:hypothetical protein
MVGRLAKKLDPQQPPQNDKPILKSLQSILSDEMKGNMSALRRAIDEFHNNQNLICMQTLTKFLRGKHKRPLSKNHREVLLKFIAGRRSMSDTVDDGAAVAKPKQPSKPRTTAPPAIIIPTCRNNHSLEQRVIPPHMNDGPIMSLLTQMSYVLEKLYFPSLMGNSLMRNSERTNDGATACGSSNSSTGGGCRYEITVDTKMNGTLNHHRAFDRICNMMLTHPPVNDELHCHGLTTPEHIKNCLITYAAQMAVIDDRVDPSWKFEQFSIIVQIGPCKMQQPHVDLLLPSFQFEMMISPNSKGTVTYQATGPQVRTAQDFVTFLGLDGSESTQILEAFEQKDGLLSRLLTNYGVVLSTVPTPGVEGFRISKLRHSMTPGTVLSTPGSVMHGSPAIQDGFRAVLSYTGRPGTTQSCDITNVQWYDGILLIELLMLLWTFVTKQDRIAILQKLVLCIKRTPELHLHYQDDDDYELIREFLWQVKDKPDNSQAAIHDFLRHQSIDGNSNARMIKTAESDEAESKMESDAPDGKCPESDEDECESDEDECESDECASNEA